jgi:tetratricopeptide (TPR) repeat protein
MRWQRGRIAEERGDKVAAARLYQGIESGPRALAAQLRAYRLLREQGAPEMAEMLIDDFLGAAPGETIDVVSGVAAILVEEGRGEEAIALVDRARESVPDDGLLLARAFLLERLDRVPEAVADMRAVAKRRPDDPATLNAPLVQSGRLEEGKGWLERAWESSEDPEVAAHLGETLWRMGRPEDAKKLWDEALAANPDSPPLKRAIERRSQ